MRVPVLTYTCATLSVYSTTLYTFTLQIFDSRFDTVLNICTVHLDMTMLKTTFMYMHTETANSGQ